MRVAFLFFGMAFGFVLIRSGVSNYDVIREMFLLRSFHLYGVLGVAVATAFTINLRLKRTKWKSLLDGQEVDFSNQPLERRHVAGGLLAGLGWALTGACPGPALAQIGYGTLSGLFTFTGILMGTYFFGRRQSFENGPADRG